MKIFIGSSSEAAVPNGLLDIIANVVQECGKTPVKWNKRPSLFRANKSILENLEEMPTREKIDASIFIFTEDDKTDYRGNTIKTPRDNVIFEHGLFLGKLGKGKSVIVKKGNVTLPNDVDGIIYFDFSEGQDVGGEMDLIQWLNELDETANHSGNSHIKSEMEQELDNIKENGIVNFYTLTNNAQRNIDKRDFLENEKGDLFLVAHTGNSFLHTSNDGNEGRFFSEFKERLIQKPYKAKIILLNPYSLEAKKIFYTENFEKYQHNAPNLDLLKQGKNSQRFIKCVEGIEEIKESLGENSDKLEVKVSDFALDCSILMSDNQLFYEPYLSSRPSVRMSQGLNTFEIKVKNLLSGFNCNFFFSNKKEECNTKCSKFNLCKNNLYKAIAEQFYILWEISIPLSGFQNKYSNS